MSRGSERLNPAITNKHGCLLNISVRAGESNEGWVSTIEVCHTGATEGQVLCPHGFHQVTKKPVGIWTSNQVNADPFGHLAVIKGLQMAMYLS